MQSTKKSVLQVLLTKSQRISSVRVLIVGVGGIGCELLKVLCKLNVGQIHIVDMDTIETSNLNRQFLFKYEHRGKSKATTACQVIKSITNKNNIIAHHSNIKQLQISFFKEFDIILMALDNVEARNYVNKIGVRLGIPIIDAGTLAYKGNTMTIIPKETKCYACQQKSTVQKVFPVCTIRSRPQKPIHCIVWAKMLFEVFFGASGEQNDLSDLGDLINTMKEKQGNAVKKILRKLFKTDIQELRQSKNQSQKQVSLIFCKSLKPLTEEEIVCHYQPILNGFKIFDKVIDKKSLISLFQQSFILLHEQKMKDGFIIFEKDDDNIIHFISSCANLRMHCFSIPEQSFHQVKNMVGNIIPAIASTNSIVSGLQIIQLIKILQNAQNNSTYRSYFIQNQSNKVLPMKLEAPQPNCPVCSYLPLTISTNLQNFTTQNFIKLIQDNYKIINNCPINQYSINLGATEVYLSAQPKENILKTSIYKILSNSKQCKIVEGEFTLIDEDTSMKICSVWLINTSSDQVIIANSDALMKKVIKQNLQKGEDNGSVEMQSSDIIMMQDKSSSDIQIIEVKKREHNDINGCEEEIKGKKIIKID